MPRMRIVREVALYYDDAGTIRSRDQWIQQIHLFVYSFLIS